MNFFRRYKKLFLIFAFLGLVAILAYLIWQVFFRVNVPSPIATSTPTNIGGLPTAEPGDNTGGSSDQPGSLPGSTNNNGAPDANTPSAVATGGLTKTKSIVNTPSLNPTLSSNNGIQYYNQADGIFYTVDKNGKITKLSDKVFFDVEQVVWAPDKDQAILEYPDGNKILYNFKTEQQVTLPAHWEDFSFSPASNQIVAKSIGLDPENRWLTIAQADGSQAQNLESIGNNGDTVYDNWSPNQQIVAMYTKGLDFDRQEVYFVGLNGENFKSTIIEGRGFQPQWSTTGDRLLYSVYNSNDNLNPKLWIVDASGDTISQNRTNLGLATWADKCTFASNTEVYCAVPETLPRGAGLFPELADRTKDNLYKINLATGAQELIAVPDGAYNVSQIMVPTDGNYLYFTDKQTGQIYQIRLH